MGKKTKSKAKTITLEDFRGDVPPPAQKDLSRFEDEFYEGETDKREVFKKSVCNTKYASSAINDLGDFRNSKREITVAELLEEMKPPYIAFIKNIFTNATDDDIRERIEKEGVEVVKVTTMLNGFAKFAFVEVTSLDNLRLLLTLTGMYINTRAIEVSLPYQWQLDKLQRDKNPITKFMSLSRDMTGTAQAPSTPNTDGGFGGRGFMNNNINTEWKLSRDLIGTETQPQFSPLSGVSRTSDSFQNSKTGSPNTPMTTGALGFANWRSKPVEKPLVSNFEFSGGRGRDKPKRQSRGDSSSPKQPEKTFDFSSWRNSAPVSQPNTAENQEDN